MNFINFYRGVQKDGDLYTKTFELLEQVNNMVIESDWTKSKWKKASVKDKKKALKTFSYKYVDYEWDALPDNVKEMVLTGKITDYYGILISIFK